MRLDLSTLDQVPAEMRPGYDPTNHGTGILHLGLGAFHRAHQAAYTDTALAQAGGDWRVASVSLRSTDTADALGEQDGLYTLIERGAQGDRARVIASVAEPIAAAREPEAAPAKLADAAIRIVTLTVTEKAYGIDRQAMDVDPDHAQVAADLAAPRRPEGVLGVLTEGLRRRREAGHAAPTILCCDNLPENGVLLRAGLLGFARRVDPDLAEWIAQNVAFPSSMVDRITPSPTDETKCRATDLLGLDDAAAVETEPFTQWVIEDRFPAGRPAWEAAGAIFVEDVAPFERMKLRMLNGAHSLIAYAGFLAGHEFVRDVMAEPALAGLADRHLRAASRQVGRLEEIDLGAYRAELLERFSNPAIAHRTYQIAADGTQKLPQRLLAPALEAVKAGDNPAAFAFAVAAWMRFATGRNEAGESYALNDPREDEIRAAVEGRDADAAALAGALMDLPGLFPRTLSGNDGFRRAVETRLAEMVGNGMDAAVAREAE